MNKIKFASPSGNKDIIPVPAKTQVPDWYKNAERFIGGKLEVKNKFGNHGLKLCVPFLDALTAGYTARLWTDVHIIKDNKGRTSITWEDNIDPILRRETVNKTIPIPIGCSNQHMAWSYSFHMQLPKGYSAILTHPINRYDLPFMTLTGFVDADYTQPRGEYPFFIKEDFEGVIEKGTPIFQIIPFKRENWSMQIDDSIIEVGLKNEFLTGKHLFGWYKKNKWKKKIYE